ncbi:Retrovirus-related Pol polyprotein from transposon TNT 1-94 [Araneus ventricosus]|uniref:Retrovirus-related Pol polyprotein from transposon TNT 1-94 n=1 Tax=Araneus ventricosus TaxID=182803 RepID=A0A4Y2BM98_ARAVE|nr:Retrovirus-related Pol polyprotein from transposon TNT 1-94 [Araneus ventricosus]
MKGKTEVFSCFTRYQKRAERFTNSKIVNIRTDNGMEFCYIEFDKFLEDQGIHAERTNVFSLEENGVSERFNCTAMDAVKVMLKDSGLGNGFWVEALLCFTYVWNRVCHKRQKKTPFELFGGRKPSVKHFKIFGTTAYVGVPRQTRSKPQMRSKKGIMVGYALQTRGYRIWIPSERRVVETINLTFNENKVHSGAVLDPKNKNLGYYPSYSETNSEVDYEISNRESSAEVKREVEPESLTEIKTENFDESNNLRTPLSKVVWVREAAPRRDKSRIDIFYKVEGTNSRFNSKKAVESYCKSNNIKYDPTFFNFSGEKHVFWYCQKGN